MLAEKATFDEECKDPARLTQRGYATRLAQEERQRKKYERMIPAMETALRNDLQAWFDV